LNIIFFELVLLNFKTDNEHDHIFKNTGFLKDTLRSWSKCFK